MEADGLVDGVGVLEVHAPGAGARAGSWGTRRELGQRSDEPVRTEDNGASIPGRAGAHRPVVYPDESHG